MLAAPLCIARLMDLLGSDHEVLRNEALLLLVGPGRAPSADIQKIVAFEGAFERALGIARHGPVPHTPHYLSRRLLQHNIYILSRSAPFPHCLRGREEGGAEGGIVRAGLPGASQQPAAYQRRQPAHVPVCLGQSHTPCLLLLSSAEAHARHVESAIGCGRETGHVGRAACAPAYARAALNQAARGWRARPLPTC